jgi:hypothetical protein
MTHTFLFEPGIWTGTGTFWTEDGQATPVEGRTEITHRQDCWLLAGSLRVQSSPPVEFVTLYHSDGGPAYFGTEHLTQIDAGHYEACGVLLLEGRRLSSWRVALSRVEAHK